MITEKKMRKYIPSDCQHKIKQIIIRENLDYDEKLRKYVNMYIVILNDNYMTINGNTKFATESIGKLAYTMRNSIVEKII
jgi:hypothetical protein